MLDISWDRDFFYQKENVKSNHGSRIVMVQGRTRFDKKSRSKEIMDQ